MIDTLVNMDERLFYWINHGHQNALFDTLMPFVTGSVNWHIPILVSWFSLLLFGGRRGRTAALLVIPLIALSDQTSSNLLKHALERVRPCNALPDVHLLVGCGGSFSMPSSHAANFGAATFPLSRFYPRVAPALLVMAMTVAYSRVYVGVHYPFDAAVGLVVGLACALLIRGFAGLGGGLLARRRQAASWR
ncbi:MAG: phosphatase PAP2 family protein [Candidatus Krumholzibacteriia bacterium]